MRRVYKSKILFEVRLLALRMQILDLSHRPLQSQFWTHPRAVLVAQKNLFMHKFNFFVAKENAQVGLTWPLSEVTSISPLFTGLKEFAVAGCICLLGYGMALFQGGPSS